VFVCVCRIGLAIRRQDDEVSCAWVTKIFMIRRHTFKAFSRYGMIPSGVIKDCFSPTLNFENFRNVTIHRSQCNNSSVVEIKFIFIKCINVTQEIYCYKNVYHKITRSFVTHKNRLLV